VEQREKGDNELRQQRVEEEKRRREEQQRLEELRSMATSWHESRMLREFLEAVKAKVTQENETPGTDPDLARWLEWAESQVESSDPLSQITQ